MKTILVVGSEDLADHLASYPFFFQLKKANPKSRVIVACEARLRAAQYSSLVDEVITLPALQQAGVLSTLRQLESWVQRLRDAHRPGILDEAITLRDDFSSAWVLSRLGYRTRIGVFTDWRSWLLTDGALRDDAHARHRQDELLALVDRNESNPSRRFWSEPAENPLDPPISGDLDRFDWRSSWKDTLQIRRPHGAYWILAPGCEDETRQWQAERYLELARKVHARTGLTGVVVGSPKDAPLAARLCGDSDAQLVDFVAQGDLAATAELMENAQFAVTGDSPYGFLSALVGKFTQIAWGARDPRVHHPQGPSRLQLSFQPVDCWPCNARVCSQVGDRRLRCVRDLSVDAVYVDLIKGLEKYHPELLLKSSLAGD
jgi:ADP-heptose:LPS heptosyltransferase